MSSVKTLEDLKKPFSDNEIGKLPKPTKKQTADALKLSWAEKQCKICGGLHHPRVVHLDYIGHAALTKRMLEVDPLWTWEPMGFMDGLPAFDKTGGLWIKLTILGVTRLGYGNAPPKGEAGNREKEVIGDALRNAGMRFGMGLDLWHKGDLQLTSDEPEPVKEAKPAPNKTMWQPIIDEVFKNPDETEITKLETRLEKEKAPAKALKYFGQLTVKYYEKREQLEKETGQ